MKSKLDTLMKNVIPIQLIDKLTRISNQSASIINHINIRIQYFLFDIFDLGSLEFLSGLDRREYFAGKYRKKQLLKSSN